LLWLRQLIGLDAQPNKWGASHPLKRNPAAFNHINGIFRAIMKVGLHWNIVPHFGFLAIFGTVQKEPTY
jgi:hypothetical protein